MFDKEFKACFKSKENGKFVYPKTQEEMSKFAEFATISSKTFLHALKRQTVFEERDDPILRLSSLGKVPLVEVLAKKFGKLKKGSKHTVDEQCRLRFIIGDIFECIFSYMLRRYGFEIVSEQTHVNWHGVGGHTDMIVITPEGEKCLLELKTANNRYFTQVKKYIGDERGYLTQLCTYSDCLGLPAYWVFFNKDTQDIFVKPLESVPETNREQALKRAKKVIDVFNNCEKWEDYPNFCVPPPPKVEKYKDGTLKFWESGEYEGKPKLYISYVKQPELYYKCEELKNDYGVKRTYVFDFNKPMGTEDKFPDIFEWGLHHA